MQESKITFIKTQCPNRVIKLVKNAVFNHLLPNRTIYYFCFKLEYRKYVIQVVSIYILGPTFIAPLYFYVVVVSAFLYNSN